MGSETHRIAVSNHKGGVGKTTTAAHLCGALAEQGYDVLAVDADPQGTLSMHLTPKISALRRFRDRGIINIEDRQMEIARASGQSATLDLNSRLPSVYEAFYERKMMDSMALRLISSSQEEYEQFAEMRGFEPGPIEENVIIETTDGFDIIPANTMMKGLETALAQESDSVMRLNGILGSISDDHYDFMVVDTPASIGVLKDGAIIACENVLIPMQAETTSVDATRQHLKDLEEMEDPSSFGIDLNIVGIMPNEVRDDGEADKVTGIIRKKIPETYWNRPEVKKPEGFDVSQLPDRFWRGEVYGDDGDLLDGVPEELADFWAEMRVKPLITERKDYTDRVTPFDIRTRVAIRRAYSNNRTLFTHPEECDMQENYMELAEIVAKRTMDTAETPEEVTAS